MIIYEHILDALEYDYKGFDKSEICFIDIETTGFSHKYNSIYLIGLVHYSYKDIGWKLVQFFADNLNDEKNLLYQFNEYIKDFKIAITYNGDSFDIPFLENRMSKYNLSSNLKGIESFDIYRKVKLESSYLNLGNFKLKTLEESIGIFRDDKYTGKDCVEFYNQYLNTKDEVLLNRILNHNYDDLYYLIPVMNIFNIIEDSKSLFILNNGNKVKVKIKNIEIQGDILIIYCEASKKDENIVFFTDNYSFKWVDDKLTVKLEYKRGLITPTMKCLFIDISKWPFKERLKDLSQYTTPDNIMLIKVEQKFIMDNIKLIIKEMILSSK